jgi:hypothetical protein
VDLDRSSIDPQHSIVADFARWLGKLVECDERLSSIAVDMTDLQTELARLRHEGDSVAQLLAEQEAALAERELSLARVQEELVQAQEAAAQASASLAEADASLGTHRTRVATLEDELESLRAEVADLKSVEAAARAEPTAAGHVRLVSLPSGYALSDCEEPPPVTGDAVEVDGKRFRVVRIGRSPLPADPRPCALLLLE